MDFKCDRCKKMKDVGEVIRTKPYSPDRKVVCYTCYDAEEAAELEKKRETAIQWLKDLFRIRR